MSAVSRFFNNICTCCGPLPQRDLEKSQEAPRSVEIALDVLKAEGESPAPLKRDRVALMSIKSQFERLGTALSDPYPLTLEKRRHPPISRADTIIVRNGIIQSAHGTGELYKDEEILYLHPSINQKDLGDGVMADFTKNGRAVIQQQATRGCTAAVAAMLICDKGGIVNTDSLKNTNLGNTDSIRLLIRNAGFISKVTNLKNNTCKLSELRKLIQRNGSAIVSTGNDIGGHVVVVDDVSKDLKSIRLRDPYHGWEITVTQEAFLRGFSGGSVVQILNKQL